MTNKPATDKAKNPTLISRVHNVGFYERPSGRPKMPLGELISPVVAPAILISHE